MGACKKTAYGFTCEKTIKQDLNVRYRSKSMNFTKKKVALGLSLVFFLLLTGVWAQDFEVNNVLFKLTLHAGESAERIFSVSSKEGGTVNLELTGVRGASLEESSLFLNKGEVKDVPIKFNSLGLDPSVYVGSIKVISTKEAAIIPVILEVESRDVVFDVNIDIPPHYKEVPSDDKLIAQVKMFDLTSGGTTGGLGPTRVETDYLIYNLNGQLVSSQSEEVVVDRQVQITKTFSFPPDLAPGDYVLAVSIRYQNSLGISTSLLEGLSFDRTILYFVIALLAFFILVISLFIYFVRDRDKLILELRDYHEQEMKQLRGFLLEQEKAIKHKSGEIKPEVVKEINTKLQGLEKQQERRERELRVLHSRGERDVMSQKLHEWKKKGYDTSILEYKLKGLTTGEMKNILSNWKRKYHAEGYKKR